MPYKSRAQEQYFNANNKGAIYGTLNKIDLMKGSKITKKGLKKAHSRGR